METSIKPIRSAAKNKSKRHSSESYFVWAVVVCTLVYFTIFFYYPFFRTIINTFFSVNYITPSKFVGLENYTTLLSDSKAFTAFRNTFLITVTAVPITIAMALVLATIIFQMKIGSGLFRTAIFATSMIPSVIAGVIFRALFDENNGFINNQLIYSGLTPIPWLTDPKSALMGIIILTIWRRIGYYMLILFAGLSAIDTTLYEAAMVDGAGAIQRFLYITIPQLRKSIIFCTIIAMIDALSSYEQVYVLTQGNPYSSTLTSALYMFQLSIRESRIGYASVIALILFVIMAVISVFQLKITGSFEE